MARHDDDDRAWMATLALGLGAFLGGRALVRRARRFDVSGRVVLVTGGSRGLGLLLARSFADRGAKVAVCARDAAELDRARGMFAADGLDLCTNVCDLTRPDQVADTVAAVRRDLGQVDVLVNNAGIIGVGPAGVMTLADYEAAMATNFWAALYATREVLDDMRRRKSGRIVNVASIGGRIAVPHLLPYSASKFALVGWSSGLRAEVKHDNVFVSTIIPGLMRTGSPRNADFKGRHRAEYAWFSVMDSLPLTSMCARRAAERIVRAAEYGEAEVTLSIQAKFAVKFAGLFPGATAEAMSWFNRMMPNEGGIGTETRKGNQSQSEWSPSRLTALTERAARENNEMR
jgi:NAD(P)-dependent dehydrogenase (short-subunit alcohol dehydrogenase family)